MELHRGKGFTIPSRFQDTHRQYVLPSEVLMRWSLDWQEWPYLSWSHFIVLISHWGPFPLNMCQPSALLIEHIYNFCLYSFSWSNNYHVHCLLYAVWLTLTRLGAQMVKRLSTMQETQVRSLGWEDPLEKEMAIHSSTIAWKIPWTEEPGRL